MTKAEELQQALNTIGEKNIIEVIKSIVASYDYNYAFETDTPEDARNVHLGDGTQPASLLFQACQEDPQNFLRVCKFLYNHGKDNSNYAKLFNALLISSITKADYLELYPDSPCYRFFATCDTEQHKEFFSLLKDSDTTNKIMDFIFTYVFSVYIDIEGYEQAMRNDQTAFINAFIQCYKLCDEEKTTATQWVNKLFQDSENVKKIMIAHITCAQTVDEKPVDVGVLITNSVIVSSNSTTRAAAHPSSEPIAAIKKSL